MTGAIFCTSQKNLDARLKEYEFPESGSEAPFAQSDWVLSSIRALDGWKKTKLVLIQDKRPLSLAPLGKRSGFFNAYEQIGVADLGEPGELLYTHEHLPRLAEALARNRIPLSLGRVPAESPLIGALKHAYRKRALVVVRSRIGCPFIALDESDGQDVKHIPEGMMRDLRRAKKRADAIGKVTVEVHTPTSAEAFEILWRRSLDIEASGWKGDAGSALKKNERIRKFYETYSSQASKKGELRICFLCIDNQAIAMQIALERNDRFWLLKIGYNEQYAKCSPGMLLMYETIVYAAKRKLKSYEFMGTAGQWTRRWTKTERENVSISTYPFTLSGMILLLGDMTTSMILKLHQRKGKIDLAIGN